MTTFGVVDDGLAEDGNDDEVSVESVVVTLVSVVKVLVSTSWLLLVVVSVEVVLSVKGVTVLFIELQLSDDDSVVKVVSLLVIVNVTTVMVVGKFCVVASLPPVSATVRLHVMLGELSVTAVLSGAMDGEVSATLRLVSVIEPVSIFPSLDTVDSSVVELSVTMLDVCVNHGWSVVQLLLPLFK